MEKIIYKNYTQVELDAEYNNQAKVANFSNYVEEWSAFCATTRQEHSNIKTYCFDEISGQKLDIIYPDNMVGKPVPVQVFFHGGYWKALSRNDFTFVARAFAKYGIATALVDYQLIPLIGMSELIRQCRQSLAYLYENADRLSLKTNDIHISGHSAGGHIAAMCLATNWGQFNSSLPDQIVASAVGISGLYDLAPIAKCFLQEDLCLTQKDVIENSPIHLPQPSSGIFHTLLGDLEGDEYLAQSDALHSAWPAQSTKATRLAPYNHFTIMSALADPTSAPSTLIRSSMMPQS